MLPEQGGVAKLDPTRGGGEKTSKRGIPPAGEGRVVDRLRPTFPNVGRRSALLSRDVTLCGANRGERPRNQRSAGLEEAYRVTETPADPGAIRRSATLASTRLLATRSLCVGAKTGLGDGLLGNSVLKVEPVCDLRRAISPTRILPLDRNLARSRSQTGSTFGNGQGCQRYPPEPLSSRPGQGRFAAGTASLWPRPGWFTSGAGGTQSWLHSTTRCANPAERSRRFFSIPRR